MALSPSVRAELQKYLRDIDAQIEAANRQIEVLDDQRQAVELLLDQTVVLTSSATVEPAPTTFAAAVRVAMRDLRGPTAPAQVADVMLERGWVQRTKWPDRKKLVVAVTSELYRMAKKPDQTGIRRIGRGQYGYKNGTEETDAPAARKTP